MFFVLSLTAFKERQSASLSCPCLLCAKFTVPFCCHFLPSLQCTKLGFGLFAPALPKSSFWGGGGVLWFLSAPAGCRIAVHITSCAMCASLQKASLQDAAFYIEIHCLQLDSSLLFASIFSLNKNFVYTGSEGEVSGKFCAFAELLHCGASEGDLYRAHTELLRKPAVEHPFADKVETSAGSGSICECFKTFFRNKMDCSTHSFVPHQLQCFAAGCS